MAGAGVGLGAMALPAAFRPVYVAWMLFGQTIGTLLMEILMAVAYFALLVPVSLCYRRWTSPLSKRPARNRDETYWEPYGYTPTPDTYQQTY
jgi:hypothetical protein